MSCCLAAQDFPCEESVVLLKRARWFEDHMRATEKGKALLEESRLADDTAWQVRRVRVGVEVRREACGASSPMSRVYPPEGYHTGTCAAGDVKAAGLGDTLATNDMCLAHIPMTV